MAPLRYAAKFDLFLCALCAGLIAPLHPGAIQGKEGIKFCHLATLMDETDFAIELGPEGTNMLQNVEVGHPGQEATFLLRATI